VKRAARDEHEREYQMQSLEDIVATAADERQGGQRQRQPDETPHG